ncbi:MAG: hypothetical protein ABIH39_09070 [Candidatus Margulisiibacteriota bacterium]
MIQNIQQKGTVADPFIKPAKSLSDNIIETIMGNKQEISKDEFIAGIRMFYHSAKKEDINELVKDLDFHYISLGLNAQDIKKAVETYIQSPAASFRFDSKGFNNQKAMTKLCDNIMRGKWHINQNDVITAVHAIDPKENIKNIQQLTLDLKLDFGTDGLSRLKLKEGIIAYMERPEFDGQSISNHLLNELMLDICFPKSNELKAKTFSIDFAMAEKIEATTFAIMKERRNIPVKEFAQVVGAAVNTASQSVEALKNSGKDPLAIAMDFVHVLDAFYPLQKGQDSSIPADNIKRSIANFVIACEHEKAAFENKEAVKTAFMPVINNLSKAFA